MVLEWPSLQPLYFTMYLTYLHMMVDVDDWGGWCSWVRTVGKRSVRVLQVRYKPEGCLNFIPCYQPSYGPLSEIPLAEVASSVAATCVEGGRPATKHAENSQHTRNGRGRGRDVARRPAAFDNFALSRQF